MNRHLTRFLIAQERDFETAFAEIRTGRKRTHWMWYIFPQIQGLGYSETSKYYALRNLQESRDYLDHPILGSRLRKITEKLLKSKETNPHLIFGSPDDLKLKSSMTLFNEAERGEDNLFKKVLDRFFQGESDSKTLQILESQKTS